MAAIVLRNYGGMAPAAAETANNPALANLVRNLDLRNSDFRPFPQAAATGQIVTPGATLYRFYASGLWITRPATVNFVRGPIPNDGTERTYYTGDGAPKVTDSSGQVRQLGVPAPTVAPVVAVNTTTQYSTDDAAADQSKKLAEVTAAVRANVVWEYVGLTDADLAARFIPQSAEAPWAYMLTVPGALDAGVFSPTNPTHRALMDERLYFSLRPLDGGGVHGVAAVDVRGAHMVVKPGLSAALAAITKPGDPAAKLFDTDQVETIRTTLLAALDPANVAREQAIPRLRSAKEQYVSAADAGSATGGANVGAVRAFYQRGDVTAQINAGVDQAVSGIYAALYTFGNGVFTTPDTGGAGPGSSPHDGYADHYPE
jgi:hypothetical protein